MLALPIPEPSEAGLSEIDRFCTLTQEAGKREVASRVRLVASALGLVCVVLLLCLGFAVSQANAVERERDALVEQLHAERAARIDAMLTAKDAERNAATYALDTRVRRDIVDEQMLEQQRRSAELERLAQEVEREKLIKADCVTPRSILVAAGL